MLEVSPPHDDEIDFFELFETLWRGKWLISAFVAISFLLGSSFIIIKTPTYVSNIVYSVLVPYPFYEKEKLISDFQVNFYSKKVFDLWKSENRTSKLVYDDFKAVKLINGFQFTKPQEDLSAYFFQDKKFILSKLVVQTDELSVINDYFKYIKFVNNQLTSALVLQAKDELNTIEKGFTSGGKSFSLKDPPYLSLNRFINFSVSGSKVFTIKPPSFPKKTSPNIILILALSIGLGGIIGVVFILLKNTIRKRKESASKV